MAILILFALGIGNVAMHKAVLESGHPLLSQAPWFLHMLGGRFSMVVEFLMLLGTMLMVSAGGIGWFWGYLLYSLFNGASAWLILSGRV